jgi:hypothetical protein
MPIHDWKRVDAGVFHDFHTSWIVELRNSLNNGILPPDYYALAEQIAGGIGPDVLTLERTDATDDSPSAGVARAVAVSPPPVRVVARSETQWYLSKQRELVIRHGSDDRIIAIIEIVSKGNKSSRSALRKFVKKAVTALARGIHLLVVDLQPPGRRDRQGIHGVLWEEITGDEYTAPTDKPLTLAAYAADMPVTAYVEPVAVGDVLPDMPLFLDPDHYVPVPLEATYQQAYRGVPKRWRDVLEASAG